MPEISLKIDGKIFNYWSEIKINRSIDSIDSIEFVAPFDHEAPGFRDTFKPFSYKPVTVEADGRLLFTGTMINPRVQLGPGEKSISVSCYSACGALMDCTAPASMYPIEYDSQGLRDIAGALLQPFNVGLTFSDDQGAVFERVSLDPEQVIFDFLSGLAKQRGLLLSSDEAGALLIWRPVSVGLPVARLTEGSGPLISVQPFFSNQEYYSHITGIEPVVVGLAGSQYTVRNERLSGIMRPFCFQVPDTLDADVKSATEAKAGRMFGNAVSYQVAVNTWEDSRGSLWVPNSIIKLLAPSAMIYNEYAFTIRSIELTKTASEETAALDLVLPGSFEGRQPESLPWD